MIHTQYIVDEISLIDSQLRVKSPVFPLRFSWLNQSHFKWLLLGLIVASTNLFTPCLARPLVPNASTLADSAGLWESTEACGNWDSLPEPEMLRDCQDSLEMELIDFNSKRLASIAHAGAARQSNPATWKVRSSWRNAQNTGVSRSRVEAIGPGLALRGEWDSTTLASAQLRLADNHQQITLGTVGVAQNSQALTSLVGKGKWSGFTSPNLTRTEFLSQGVLLQHKNQSSAFFAQSNWSKLQSASTSDFERRDGGTLHLGFKRPFKNIVSRTQVLLWKNEGDQAFSHASKRLPTQLGLIGGLALEDSGLTQSTHWLSVGVETAFSIRHIEDSTYAADIWLAGYVSQKLPHRGKMKWELRYAGNDWNAPFSQYQAGFLNSRWHFRQPIGVKLDGWYLAGECLLKVKDQNPSASDAAWHLGKASQHYQLALTQQFRYRATVDALNPSSTRKESLSLKFNRGIYHPYSQGELQFPSAKRLTPSGVSLTTGMGLGKSTNNFLFVEIKRIETQLSEWRLNTADSKREWIGRMGFNIYHGNFYCAFETEKSSKAEMPSLRFNTKYTVLPF